MNKINYILITTILIQKIIDILLTIVGLSLGAIELNPLGFNSMSILINFLMVIFLYIFNYSVKDKVINSMLLGIIIIFNIIGIYVIFNNINVITYMVV